MLHYSKQINPWPFAVIGAFLVVFAAGGTTLYLALQSDPGTVSGAYEKALKYDLRASNLRIANELGLEITASISEIRVKLRGDYSKTEISGAFASDQTADFSGESMRKEGDAYVLNRSLPKGTWFLNLKFDDLEFQVSQLIS